MSRWRQFAALVLALGVVGLGLCPNLTALAMAARSAAHRPAAAGMANMPGMAMPPAAPVAPRPMPCCVLSSHAPVLLVNPGLSFSLPPLVVRWLPAARPLTALPPSLAPAVEPLALPPPPALRV